MNSHDVGLNVSRETYERLEVYLGLLKKWNPAINLVAKSTIDDAWARHFVDSAQIYRQAPERWSKWVDLGSGGGFPGAVIAVLAAEFNPAGTITLVESDQRKAAFLRNVFRETGVGGAVISKRIEAVDSLGADVISARALAELTKLLEFADHHASKGATLLFPKGVNWQKEITQAEESWSFEFDAITSETDPNAIVLRIGGLARV